MRGTNNGVATYTTPLGEVYSVTRQQVQEAFELLDAIAVRKDQIGKKSARLLDSLTPAKSRGRPKGTSTFDLKRAKELREQGQTYDDIAAELGCSSRTVIRKLKGE